MDSEVNPSDEGRKPVATNGSDAANREQGSPLPTYMRKGVRRFKTHEEMNREDELIAQWRRTHPPADHSTA